MLVVIAVLLILSMLIVLGWNYRKRHSTISKQKCKNVKLCAVLGSGGHTTEMFNLLNHLSSKYTPRLYIIGKSDLLSLKKVREMEEKRNGVFDYILIDRSREVLQSYFTSVFTVLLSFAECLWIAASKSFDVLICNGPGTCVPVCVAVALFDLFRLRDTKIIYFESICRVQRLSLSGKLLYFLGISDLFVVQWPELAEKYPKASSIDNLQKKHCI